MEEIDKISLCSEAQAELFRYYPTPPPVPVLYQYLAEVFKLDNFRPSQLEAIQAVLSGRDCFVSMATGSGKSLVWQLPALLQTGPSTNITVVICPTKALIMDQMNKLCKLARVHTSSKSLEAICYHTDQPQDLNSFSLWLLRKHNMLPHCLLVVPELLREGHIKQRLQDIHKAGRLARFVIDEADKFLGWGQSFRDSYLELSCLRKAFPDTPLLAMSGSITKAAMETSIGKLGMQQCVRISESLDRPNLHYEVKQKLKRNFMLPEVIDLARSGPGIIYCTYKSETEEIAGSLRHRGIRAQAYHTDLPKMELKGVQDMWRKDQIRVVVATIAFGMGIDKKNVRWVVHDTMPSSIEGWFQESGRAGRDGLPARSIIYFQIEDYYKVKQVIAAPISGLALASCLEPLHQVTEVLLDPVSCRRQRLLRYFGEDYQAGCGACDHCNQKYNIPWSLQDVTIDAINAINLLVHMRGISAHPHWTENNLAAAIYGERSKLFRDFGVTALQGFGCHFALTHGQNATKSRILEFLQVLMRDGIITEYKRDPHPATIGSSYGHYYIKPGTRAKDVVNMRYPVRMYVGTDPTPQPNDEPEQEVDVKMEQFPVIQEVNSQTGEIMDVIVID